ncbi:MAG: DoxX family protein [Alphaproteobacteria bacterium]|nr:DoxX family protein [Alphaproteobacteria bacterium]
MSTAAEYCVSANPAGAVRYTWAGRVLSGLAIAFLVMDGVMKLVQPQVVIESTTGIGWPADAMMLTVLGMLLLVCTALYSFSRTAVLGAILLTGYLGGAVASHVRLGDPLLTHDLFGVYLGVFVWGGLWFRDPRIRALIPFRA